jgi:hypothetical protein
MSIKNTCKLRVLVTAKLSKERCIFLATRRKLSELHEGIIEKDVTPLQLEKHIFPKWVYRKYETWNTHTKPL